MVVERLKIPLDEHEYRALILLAQAELRPISDQAHAIIRTRLRQLGLLDADRPVVSDPGVEV